MEPSSNDLSSPLVQEVAASLKDHHVPDNYIRKDIPLASEKPMPDDLTIDFSRICTEDELANLRSTLSNWGCVQLVNHGIEAELLDKVMEVSKQFFALPLEEKKKSYGDPAIFNGYTNDGALRKKQPHNWSDGLYLRLFSNDPADLRFWPQNPPEFRKTVRELTDKIRSMPEIILKAMARSLNLEEDCILKCHGLDGALNVRFNFYPYCPNPDKVLGAAPHTDGATFTLLLQDQQGLEIMGENGGWFKIPVVPGALLLLFGDLAEVLSNGAIKSTLHRVVVNSEKERVSAAIFYNPNTLKEIGPVCEMVSANRPQMYKKVGMVEFSNLVKNGLNTGESPLSALRIDTMT